MSSQKTQSQKMPSKKIPSKEMPTATIPAEDKQHDPTDVKIFGRSYRLRGSENGEYLNRLAKLVDGKMREIADATGTADSQKLAILACLNMADDNIRIEEAQGTDAASELSFRSDTEERLKILVVELDEALAR